MKLSVKNMVCNRCIIAVRNVFESSGIIPLNISLGEVTIKEKKISKNILNKIDNQLIELGFERISDRNSRLISNIKSLVIEKIHHNEMDYNTNWSDLITNTLPYEYNYLSKLFSSVEGITLEQYIIRQKIEKVKELLVYDEMTLSEIAWKLGYSSVAHLSSQFKKVTGFTTGHFRKLKDKKRKPLDDV